MHFDGSIDTDKYVQTKKCSCVVSTRKCAAIKIEQCYAGGRAYVWGEGEERVYSVNSFRSSCVGRQEECVRLTLMMSDEVRLFM